MTWIRQQWFLIFLFCCLLCGLAFHPWLRWMVEWKWLQSTIVFVVMFMMSLPIPWQSISVGISRPWPAILGSMVNMFVVPFLAWFASSLFPSDLAGGLIIAALVPCTIASAAVLTRKAAGDDTVAVLITLITNIACVIVTPLGMYWLLGTKVQFQVWPLITNLTILVVLPIFLAQWSRRLRVVQEFSFDQKLALTTACQIGILWMVLIGAIQMGSLLSVQSSMGSTTVFYLLICLVVLITHLTAFAFCWYIGSLTGIQRPTRIAVAFGGSQKTLMIGLKLAIDAQFSIIPMVAYHVLQLLIDAMIAERLAARGTRAEATKREKSLT